MQLRFKEPSMQLCDAAATLYLQESIDSDVNIDSDVHIHAPACSRTLHVGKLHLCMSTKLMPDVCVYAACT